MSEGVKSPEITIDSPSSKLITTIRNMFFHPKIEPGAEPEAFPETELKRRKMEEDLSFLRTHYGIEVDMSEYSKMDSQHIISCDALGEQYTPEIVRAVTEEIAKYPPEYIKYSGLKTIRLVENLKANSRLGKNRRLGGLAPRKAPTIYVSYREGYVDFLRETVHHEIFHKGDSAFVNGIFGPALEGLFDCSWRGLNQHEFEGYARERYQYMHNNTLEEITRIGFARVYGILNEWEDRATIAEKVMTDTRQAKNVADRDPVFFVKMRRILKLFKQRSDGKMGLNYFNDLIAGKVTKNYWFRNQAA